MLGMLGFQPYELEIGDFTAQVGSSGRKLGKGKSAKRAEGAKSVTNCSHTDGATGVCAKYRPAHGSVPVAKNCIAT